MWLCVGKDGTSNSKTQHPPPVVLQVKRGAHMSAPWFNISSIDGTDGALVGGRGADIRSVEQTEGYYIAGDV